jgi:hypothetical protein
MRNDIYTQAILAADFSEVSFKSNVGVKTRGDLMLKTELYKVLHLLSKSKKSPILKLLWLATKNISIFNEL